MKTIFSAATRSYAVYPQSQGCRANLQDHRNLRIGNDGVDTIPILIGQATQRRGALYYAGHNDGSAYTAERNQRLTMPTVLGVTALDLASETATATNTQLPTATNTALPAPTATEAPEATAIKNQVNSDADRCIGILFGRLLVPVNNFFPASLLLYNDDECSQSGGYEFSAPGDYGTAYSTTGPEAAAATCQAENADGFDYTVSPFAMHEDLYVCIRGEASATETQSTQPQQQAAEATALPTNRRK